MECNKYAENGLDSSAVFVRGSQVEPELGAGGARALRLVDAAGLPGAPAVGARGLAVGPTPADRLSLHTPLHVDPFMNTMDEISYWIYTKRAPCLMSFDTTVDVHRDEAPCSKVKPKSVPSAAEIPSPKKKKKRKLSLLDEDSGSAEKHQNVYFDTSQNKKQTVMSSKSDTLRSDIDFNIKISSVRGRPKRSKLQKNSRTTLHKKNKVVTSTPKVSKLRRSLRQAQQSLNNSHLNTSCEIHNASITNGYNQRHCAMEDTSLNKTKKTTELLAGGDQSTDNRKNTTINRYNKSKNEVLNGQFEDLSDVSGFTANYIRSTKLQSTKSPRKLRCKNSRNLVKESRPSVLKDSTMVVCMNKSVNTSPKAAAHNCSTDSVNVINLVTTKSTDNTAKVSKSTSLLKFMDLRSGKDNKADRSRTKAKGNMNVSFQSRNSTSRYPKRYRNHSGTQGEADRPTEEIIQKDNRRKISKNSSDFNNSDRKENPEATTVSRTRSGRNIGLTLRQPENSVLVLSNNSTEQVSSLVSMNVASPGASRCREQKKKSMTRHLRSKKVNDKHGMLKRDSLRDKSGFSACFSDSDDDSEPLKQRKFFCA